MEELTKHPCVVAYIFAGIRKYGNTYPYSVLYHAKVELFKALKSPIAILENRAFEIRTRG